MPEWLKTSLSNGVDPTPGLLAWRIGVAMVLGLAVAGLYRWAKRGEEVQPAFLTTLILLATLIAMATQIIGDNIARAFSLVGALSVVRFRTVVKDTQDTAFVIFSVIMGMSSGANHLAVGLVGLGIMALAAPALWPPGRRSAMPTTENRLCFRIGLAENLQKGAESVIASAAEGFELTAVSTAKQGSCMDLTYRIQLPSGSNPATLVAALNKLHGVENVDLKRGD